MSRVTVADEWPSWVWMLFTSAPIETRINLVRQVVSLLGHRRPPNTWSSRPTASRSDGPWAAVGALVDSARLEGGSAGECRTLAICGDNQGAIAGALPEAKLSPSRFSGKSRTNSTEGTRLPSRRDQPLRTCSDACELSADTF